MDVTNIVIWGNHSSTQFPDVRHGKVTVNGKAFSVPEAVKDDAWLKGAFVKVTYSSVLCFLILDIFVILYLSGSK